MTATTAMSAGDIQLALLDMASSEMELMKKQKAQQQQQASVVSSPQCHRSLSSSYHRFPPACLAMLQSLPGNAGCLDCGAPQPQWAAVSYGALVCLQCSGFHRSLGVRVSSVRSLTMDEWSLEHVLAMLEGGNGQLQAFFQRHRLVQNAFDTHEQQQEQQTANTTSVITKSNVTRIRYKTKAALFYRQQMAVHISRVIAAGPYRGRGISRWSKHHRLEHRNSTLE